MFFGFKNKIHTVAFSLVQQIIDTLNNPSLDKINSVVTKYVVLLFLFSRPNVLFN